MNQEYTSFNFLRYNFDEANKTASFTYSYDDVVQYTETYRFDFDFVQFDYQQLDRALQNLFIMAGISYYKAYLPPVINTPGLPLDDFRAQTFSAVYQRGLGEFFYVNQLDPNTPINIPSAGVQLEQQTVQVQDGLLIGLGGGKDSLFSLEALRDDNKRIATWSLGHAEQIRPLAERTGLPHLQVERTVDQSLIEHNKMGAMNGHVPISAIFACVGTVVGILAGYKTAIVSNEQSANEPTLVYNGVAINHQYSKSEEFETMYQNLLQASFGGSLEYISFTRPMSELLISELFVKLAFDTYADVFSSCNRAFVLSSSSMSWCGECPKCAFVFLALTPFVDRGRLEQLWGGKNLLLDPSLDTTYRQLLGIVGDKPLECVGAIKECRAAMQMSQQKYPELAERFTFDLPADYNYKALATTNMDPEYTRAIQHAIYL